MNPLFFAIIHHAILRRKKGKTKQQYSNYDLSKGVYLLRKNVIHTLKDILLVSVGVLAASFGFKGFLLTNHFIDGGVTGISLLVSAISGWPLYLLLIAINAPFVILGYKVLGKTFAIKTTLAILCLSLCLVFIDFPNVTNDNLLVAIFGGFFLGAGIGLSVRGGAVIDGTEILAIYLSRKLKVTIGDLIISINVLIFLAAACLLGIEKALYSMITYFVASRTLNYIIEGIDEYIGVTIVSHKNDEIKEMILQQMGRGVTIYDGKRAYNTKHKRRETEILYTVITRLELNRLNAEIDKIDSSAFVVMHQVKDTKGGMIKKRPLH